VLATIEIFYVFENNPGLPTIYPSFFPKHYFIVIINIFMV